MQRRLCSSLRLSVSAPLTGDAPYVENIWAAISADEYANTAEPDYNNGITLPTSVLLNFCTISFALPRLFIALVSALPLSPFLGIMFLIMKQRGVTGNGEVFC